MEIRPQRRLRLGIVPTAFAVLVANRIHTDQFSSPEMDGGHLLRIPKSPSMAESEAKTKNIMIKTTKMVSKNALFV